MADRSPRALVADDDPDLLGALADTLEQRGFEVVRATNGVELIDAVGKYEPFDLIVTDVAMPWMSGLQVLHSARYFGYDTPVVVITGLRDLDLATRVRTLGAHAVLLHKPFTPDALEEAIATALGHPLSAHAG